MTVKVLLILGLATATALVFRGRPSATRLALTRLLASGVLILGVAAVLFPAAVTAVAQAFGVGRGTDLVLYFFVVGFLLVSVGLYRKLRELEDRYVELVRQMALAQSDRPNHQRSEGPAPLPGLQTAREIHDHG